MAQYQKYRENYTLFFSENLNEQEKNLIPEDIVKLANYNWSIGNKERATKLILNLFKRFPEKFKFIGLHIYIIGEKEFALSIEDAICKEGDSRHCFYFAMIKYQDFGKKYDDSIVKIFVKSCDDGEGEACVYAGHYYFGKEEVDKGLPYVKRGCDLNQGECCSVLATQEKETHKKDLLLHKACDLGEGISCGMLGVKEAKAGNMKAAEQLFTKGCSVDIGTSCYYLGVYFLQQNEKEKAILFINKACNLSESKACSLLYETKK